MIDFALDPRLAAGSFPVIDLTLSKVLLMDDERFPWLVLVPRRAGASELTDLGDLDVATLWAEIKLAAGALQDLTAADKLNIAALGNMVAQLHVHVIARRRDDAAWPRPVWGFAEPRPYEPEARAAFVADLAGALTSP
jgi:diadenosine tetraphosphate (Ap4A) HIT family hydrolase